MRHALRGRNFANSSQLDTWRTCRVWNTEVVISISNYCIRRTGLLYRFVFTAVSGVACSRIYVRRRRLLYHGIIYITYLQQSYTIIVRKAMTYHYMNIL